MAVMGRFAANGLYFFLALLRRCCKKSKDNLISMNERNALFNPGNEFPGCMVLILGLNLKGKRDGWSVWGSLGE